MKAFKVTLPWPPSVNDYWGHRPIMSKRGKKAFTQVYLTARAADFRAEVIRLLKDKLGGEIRPNLSRLAYKLVYCAPTNRKYDLSNFAKGIEDALQHAGIIEDDSQFDDIRSVRGPVCRPDGCVHMLIWKCTKQPHEQLELFNAR